MKVFNYVILIVGMIAIFEMGGIPTGFSNLLQVVGINVGTASTTVGSTFYITVLAVLAAATLTGIAVGFITKASSENYVILPLIISSFFFFGGYLLSSQGSAILTPLL